MSGTDQMSFSIWKKARLAGIIALLLTTITACGTSQPESTNGKNKSTQSGSMGNMDHNHGIAFSSDGKTLFLAEHNGLRAYQNNSWKPPLNSHDLMGFTVTHDTIYVSGHPGDNTLKNPLGLAKLVNGGKTVQPIVLYGKEDFHEMAASYRKGTIYVNNEMDAAGLKKGLNYTQNSGTTWNSVQGEGISGKIQTIAVHPFDDSIVAVGTENGLFLSKDHGNHFNQILKGITVNGLYFSLSAADELYVGGYDKSPLLYRMDLANNQKTIIKLPFSDLDTVTFMAQNPQKLKELAIATFKNRVYLTTDEGLNWRSVPLK